MEQDVGLVGCCHRCTRAAVDADGGNALDFRLQRMFLCATCGNKRCPHASDHRFACTGSNVPGQAGSAYGEPVLDDAGVLALLQNLAREHGSISAWAKSKGIHPEIAMAVMRGKRPPAKTMLQALGLRRVITYAPICDRDGAEGGDANAAPVPQDRHARAEGIAHG